jgi:hypothetical protein
MRDVYALSGRRCSFVSPSHGERRSPLYHSSDRPWISFFTGELGSCGAMAQAVRVSSSILLAKSRSHDFVLTSGSSTLCVTMLCGGNVRRLLAPSIAVSMLGFAAGLAYRYLADDPSQGSAANYLRSGLHGTGARAKRLGDASLSRLVR